MKTIDEDKKLKMTALALMVSNKVVSKDELNKIWEVAKMMKLKILEIAEEKGIEQGIEQGIEKGIVQGIERGTEKGINISTEIMRDLVRRMPVNEIAARHKVSIDTVKQLQSVLPQLSA